MESDCVGIDLGTSSSCVCIIEGGQPKSLENDMGSITTPSVVGFSTNCDRIVVGENAEWEMEAKNIISAVKRIIGRRFDSKEVQKQMDFVPYEIVDVCGKPQIQLVHNGKTVQYTPEKITSIILRELVSIAEKRLGKDVRKAVITVPHHFDRLQQEATKAAALKADLLEVELLREPIAAAMSYGLDDEASEKRNILVFDLGAGTFDVTVLTIENLVLNVRATGGDNSLGGNDFTNRMVEYFAKQIKKKWGKDVAKYPTAKKRLSLVCETLKKDLSDIRSKASLCGEEICGLFPDLDFVPSISREKFEELNYEDFKRVIKTMEDTLKESGIQPGDISVVVMVGGSTRIPFLKEEVNKFFGREDVIATRFPEEAVARGAAIRAARKAGNSVSYVSYTDILPLSVRICLDGGITKTLAEKGQKLPCEVTKRFATSVHEQTKMTFQFCEGERPVFSDNAFLGTLELVDLSPASRGVTTVSVTLKVDENSNLSISASEDDSENVEHQNMSSLSRKMTSSEISFIVNEALRKTESDSKEVLRINRSNKLKYILQDILKYLPEYCPETDSKDRKILERLANQKKIWLQSEEGKSASESELRRIYEELKEPWRNIIKVHSKLTKFTPSSDTEAM